MFLNIQYIENVRYLSSEEWTDMIYRCISKIKTTSVGNLLLDNINHFRIFGHKINITNYVRNRQFQYPNMSFTKNNNSFEITICIPDTPYFTKVPIMSPDLKNLSDLDTNINNIYSCQEITEKIDNDFVKSFCVYKFQPTVVMLFHELVHALRLLKGIHSDQFEEEATMYGIKGNSLFLNGELITENTFRKQIGLFPRISHDAEYLHVYGTSHIINNKTKEFWKNAFDKIKLKI